MTRNARRPFFLAPAVTSPAGSARRRGGFTLIELLVVISIIVVVLGLLVSGFSAVRENMTNRATEDRFNRLQLGLNTEYGKVVQKADEKTPDPVLQHCGDRDRAKAVHIAATLRAFLPDRFDEVTAFPVGGHTYQPKATFKSVAAVTGVFTRDEESAILLYLILTEQSLGGSGADTAATGEHKVIAAPNGKEFKVFVDPRGTPIAFRRWEQNGELDSVDYAVKEPSGSIDPLDPKGLVATWSSAVAAEQTEINRIRTALFFANTGKVADTRNRLPTLVGYGKDRKSATAPEKVDDIMGYRLNRYGKRGK